MTYTTIARHSVGSDFSIGILTRAGCPGFLVVRIDDRAGRFVTLAREADEASARARANRQWMSDMS